MPEDTLIEFHEGRVVVGRRVRKLVRRPADMERFREMLLVYCTLWWWKRSTRRIWDRRFRDHQDRIILYPRLRDEDAGPPDPGSDWRYTVLHLHHPEQTIEVVGWVPQDLLIELRPELETALPLCDRPRTLEEKYVIMAAIHDQFYLGVEKIGSWPDQVQDNSVRAYVDPTLYRQTLSEVAKLTVSDQPAIEEFLADVEDDLVKTSAGAVRRLWHILRTCALPWRRARYPIEAELLRSPTLSETPPSEALPQPQQSQASDGNRSVHIQNILVVQPQGFRPDQSSGESNEQEPPAAGDGEGGVGVEASQTDIQRPTEPGPDFRSVRWYGVYYTFTANQAAIVKELWRAWKQGTPEMSDSLLLMKAECTGDRLRDAFKDHPAWGTMIVAGSTKGTRRLKPPPT